MPKKSKIPSGNIKCPQCDQLIEEGSSFCPECGIRIPKHLRYNTNSNVKIF